ncbi:MAG: M48 family metallopeptidase [Kiritimatiellae bacterium]|nr:M48 family metallopeptidase [Kiritimatiellia bacterium]
MKISMTVKLLAVAAIAGCRSVPMSDRTQLMLSAESSERAMGSAGYAEYMDKYKVTSNAKQQELLQRVGNAIREAAGESAAGFDWEFNVLETKTVNAVCFAGGKVAVLTGIMPKFANEAEMAAVVGHEIGHAIARHSGERISWGYLQTIGSLGFAYWGGSNSKTIYDIASQYGVMLPYSRSHESEADIIGLYLMSKAGYSPKAAVDFWSRFGSGTSGFLDELLSTHPCDESRIANISEHMAVAEDFYRQCKNKKGLGVKLCNGIPVDESGSGTDSSQQEESERNIEIIL